MRNSNIVLRHTQGRNAMFDIHRSGGNFKTYPGRNTNLLYTRVVK